MCKFIYIYYTYIYFPLTPFEDAYWLIRRVQQTDRFVVKEVANLWREGVLEVFGVDVNNTGLLLMPLVTVSQRWSSLVYSWQQLIKCGESLL